jgi:hypothetical protein
MSDMIDTENSGMKYNCYYKFSMTFIDKDGKNETSDSINSKRFTVTKVAVSPAVIT